MRTSNQLHFCESLNFESIGLSDFKVDDILLVIDVNKMTHASYVIWLGLYSNRAGRLSTSSMYIAVCKAVTAPHSPDKISPIPVHAAPPLEASPLTSQVAPPTGTRRFPLLKDRQLWAGFQGPKTVPPIDHPSWFRFRRVGFGRRW